MKKDLFIKQLTNGDALENFIVGLKQVTELKDKNGNIYYGLELVDNSGSMKAKIWSDALDSIERKALVEGKVVKVSGNVSMYRNELQMVVFDLYEAQPEEFSFADIAQSSEKDIDELWKELISYVDKVEDQDLKKGLNVFLEKYGEQFKLQPAAERLHHAYRGGLLEHVIELLNLADCVKKFYESDFDLVITGIILHDTGKLRELAVNSFVNVRTDEGKLKGHLIMSYDIVRTCMPESLPKNKLLKLEHIILSHHGVLEFGSPVTPKTIEAIIVHSVDELSARIKQYQRVIKENEGSSSSFSQKDWALGTEVFLG